MKKFLCTWVLLTLLFSKGVAFIAEASQAPVGADDLEANEEFSQPDGRVYLEGEFLNGNLLKVVVMAEDIASPVVGVSFNLQYDSTLVEFLKYEPGSFLERGGDPFYLVRDKLGEVIFGSTLRRDDSFPLGSGEIVEVLFQIGDSATEEDEFEFGFERGVVATIDTVRQDLENIEWEDNSFGRGESSRVIFDSSDYFKTSMVESGNKYILPVILIGLAALFGVGAIFFIKKQGRKRVGLSVNFK